jgi:hypothetical protein
MTQPAEPLVSIYLTNGARTSQGPIAPPCAGCRRLTPVTRAELRG